MTPIRSCYSYCRAVCAQVRFKPDHAAITEELFGHILDRRDALMEQGLSRQEAEARAVAAMGDPEEVGKALNKEHSWLLGWFQVWFHRLFSVGLVCLVLLALRYALPTLSSLLPHSEQGYVFNQWVPIDNDSITYDQNISQNALLDFRPEVSVRTDDYTFTVTRAVLRESGGFLHLDYILKVTHWNPQNANPEFRDYLSAVDDLGNWYLGRGLNPDDYPNAAGVFRDSAGNPKASYAFVTYYEMWVGGIEPEAKELTLVYDRAGHQVHLTLSLTDEEVAS